MRWGFFFVVDELTARFFFAGTSSVVGGLSTKESIRPLRRREFVGNGGTGVADLDSAEKHNSLVRPQKNQVDLVADLSGCHSMVPVLASAEGYPWGYFDPSLVALDMRHREHG